MLPGLDFASAFCIISIPVICMAQAFLPLLSIAFPVIVLQFMSARAAQRGTFSVLPAMCNLGKSTRPCDYGYMSQG